MTDPTTPEGRAELRQLLDDGKRDHWEVCTDGRTIGEDAGDDMAKWIGEAEPCAAELIVAAVTALPALLDAFDRVLDAGRVAMALADAEKYRADVAEDALTEAQDTIRGYESAVEGLATTIGEQRQQLSAIRAYAQELHALADTTRDAGGDYLAHTYRGIATALDRKIGDKP